MAKISRRNFKKRFDTSVIEPHITDRDVHIFIEQCKEFAYFFAGLAFNLHQIPLAVELLKGSGIHVAAPLAYPLGGLPTEIKKAQVEFAIDAGVQQIDVCMAVEALLVGDYEYVEKDIAAVVDTANAMIESISFIPSTYCLTREQQLMAARIVKDVGATYKTNAGFGPVTLPEDVRLIREELGNLPEIMVSGGCRTVEDALAFFDAGANKIATSTPFEIFKGLEDLLFWQDEGGD